MIGGKYRITRFLAEGGMGVVYEALHVVVKRRFAVKFLRADYARKREFLVRFRREAEAAGGLQSEHITSAVDFGVAADGSPYLIMEYLDGESLGALLERETVLSYQRAVDLCIQACHGAATAHAAGIVHRDLKPSNLFLCHREDGSEQLKILDFGIAKLASLRQDHLNTQTGTVLGTPAYMSPEQARGERSIDLRTDIYALGAILYEMLTGESPHPGDSPHAVLYHISSHPAVPLGELCPELPEPLVEIVEMALAMDPAARPQSAKAFAAGLARFAKRVTWSELANLEVPTLTPSRSTRASFYRRNVRWVWGGALVAGMALAGGFLLVAKPTVHLRTMPMAAVPPKVEPPAVSPILATPPAPSPVALPASPGVAATAPDRPSPEKPSHLVGRPRGRPTKRPLESDGHAFRPEVPPNDATSENSTPVPRFDLDSNPYAPP